MKRILLFIVLITFVSCNAQQKITATKNAQGNLVGYANKSSFKDASFNDWFTLKYNNYNPDKNIIKELKKSLKNVTIKGFMGTWCSDSKRETPLFYKILEQVEFNFKNLDLIAVNKNKKTPANLEKGLNIFRVPTFIFYKNGKEIGRYVEYARESLEKDMLRITTGKKYKHSYQK